MLKFLRKYNKILLVFFGVFIMISFLVPQAIQQLGQGGPGTTVMTVDGQRVSFAEVQRAAKQVDALGRLTGGLLPAGVQIDPRGDHWMLARMEADRSALVGGPSAGRQLLSELPRSMVASRLEQQIGPQWQQFINQSPELQKQVEEQIQALGPALEQERQRLEGAIDQRVGDIDQALAEVRGIQVMRALYRTTPRMSEPRIVRRARELLDQTELEVLFLDGRGPLAEKQSASTEAALREHFEKYRSAKPGENEFGFSYVQPPRFKLEYLKLDRPAIEATVRVDPVEVQKRLLAGGSAPKPEELSQRRREIEEALRAEQTDRLMNEATTAIKSALLTSVVRLPDAGGFKVLPEGWTRPDLSAIAAAIPAAVKERTGADIPAPAVVSKVDRWIATDQFQELGEFAFTGIRRGANQIRATDVLQMTRELLPAGSGPRAVAVQAGVPLAEPLTDMVGSRFFLLVVEALPESPAREMSEVLEAVVRDRKRVEAFELLKAKLPEYESLAAEQGMEALAAKVREDLGIGAEVRRVRVSGSGGVQNAPVGLNVPAFVERVQQRSAKIDPTKPLDTLTGADRTVAMPLNASMSVVIGRITGYIPMTQEQFRQRAAGLMAAFASDSLGENADDPFTAERLTRRLNVQQRGAPAQAPADAAPSEQAPAGTPPASGTPSGT
jgi:hypothetical protein